MNDQANARLSKIADDTIFTRPMTFSRNVREDWTPPDRTHAGQILKLPGLHETIGDGTDGPSLETTMVDLSHLAADREELEAHLELQGEMHGVPKEQWRLRGGNSLQASRSYPNSFRSSKSAEARQILMESTEKDWHW